MGNGKTAKKWWMTMGLVVGWVTVMDAAPLYRRGCEFPMEGVQVCWEATGEMGSDASPLKELHLMPISQEVRGELGVMAEYTRGVYRQLLPSGMTTGRLVQEWHPAAHLEEAIVNSQQRGWTRALWIAPRILRGSSSATSGLVDWDVYLIDGQAGSLVRTMRVRVESHPFRHDKSQAVKKGLGVAGALAAAGALTSAPFASLAGITAASTQNTRPNDAGASLELMTELAARQLLFVLQYPLEELKPPSGDDTVTDHRS